MLYVLDYPFGVDYIGFKSINCVAVITYLCLFVELAWVAFYVAQPKIQQYMGKTKQTKVNEVKAQTPTPMKMSIYKPIPKFNAGCKNC